MGFSSGHVVWSFPNFPKGMSSTSTWCGFSNVKRDRVQPTLAAAGIGTMVYFPVPLHRLPVLGYPEGTFPLSKQIAVEVLSLLIGPFLEDAALRRVAGHLAVAM